MPFPTHIVAAGGFVEDGEGNILLVKTRDGGWVYPGGQVEVGENLMDALVREINEESGIDTTVSYLIGVYSNTGKLHGVCNEPRVHNQTPNRYIEVDCFSLLNKRVTRELNIKGFTY